MKQQVKARSVWHSNRGVQLAIAAALSLLALAAPSLATTGTATDLNNGNGLTCPEGSEAVGFILSGSSSNSAGQSVKVEGDLTLTFVETITTDEAGVTSVQLEIVSMVLADFGPVPIESVYAKVDSTIYSFETGTVYTDTLDFPEGATSNVTHMWFCTYTSPPTGSLVITKAVTDGGGGVFSFSYSCTDGTSGEVTIDTTDENPDSVTIDGITGGSSCSVTEAEHSDYDLASVTPEGGSATVPALGSATVAFTNERKTQPITINKTITEGFSGTFTFTVSCLDPTLPEGTEPEITTVEVSSGGSSVINVPAGSTCSVVETASAGYSASWVDAETVDPDGDGTAVVTAGGSLTAHNERLWGQVIASKTTDMGNGTFPLQLLCTGDGPDVSAEISLTTVEGSATADAIAVPVGYSCTLSEALPEGSLYELDTENSVLTGTVSADTTLELNAHNVRKTTSLVISKTSIDGVGTFNFTLSCTDPSGVNLNDTTLTITTTTDGTPTTLTQTVPTGSSCTVTETGLGATWQLDGASTKDVVWDEAGVGSVAFVNRKLLATTVGKFYDTNLNGIFDEGEPTLAGWEFTSGDATAYTDDNGVATFYFQSGTYAVTESLSHQWLATTPETQDVVAGADTPVWFGNVCLAGGGGHTKGFWHNRNGQRLIDNEDIDMLQALHLVDEQNVDFDPMNGGELSRWLKKSRATNMAYMLSAQLAASALNVSNGFVDGEALVYAPAVPEADELGFITVNDLIAAADQALADGASRSEMEAYKNALDSLNNNLNFLQATPCPTPVWE